MGRPPAPPDFPQLIRTINAHGLSCRTIARRLHVSPSAVCRWLTQEHTPNYRNGSELVFLADILRESGDVGRGAAPLREP